MRYTYKKKQKFYQLNTITSLNIHSNKPNLRKYPSILALFSKIYNFTNQRFPQHISRIYRAQYSINRARRSIARWKYSKCLSWETKVLSNYLCESYHACSENTFSAHSRESWLSNLGLRLGPPKTSDRSQLLSGLKISEMIADLFFHQISLGLPSATQNANYFLLRFFFRLMSSIQLLSSLF